MSYIHITFDPQTCEAQNTPVPVEVYDEHFKRVAYPVMRLRKHEKVAGKVEVPGPGLYLIRATLPSGENLEASVHVPSSTDEATVLLESEEPSPHESLAWAYANQSVQRVSGVARAALPQWLESPVDKAATPLLPSPQVEVTGLFRMDLTKPDWTLVPATDVTCSENVTVATDDERLIKEFHITRQQFNPWQPAEDWFPLYVRRMVHGAPDTPAESGFVAIPPGPMVTLLFVRTDTDPLTKASTRTLVSAANPGAEALLSYLNQGAIGAARRISGEIVSAAAQMLQKKEADPVSAVIAGYFLLRASRLEKQIWMRNLAEWFPGLPDGAVIYASSLLRDENANGLEEEEARHYLLEAVKRGIPIYTAGLRLLFDNLRQLAGEDSPGNALHTALAKVRFVAAYADWNATTTSFSVPSDAENLPFRLSG